MNNIFVTNYKDQDFLVEKTAEYRGEFGKVVPITEGVTNAFDTDELQSAIRYVLKNNRYDPETDYILIAGNAIIASIILRVITMDYPTENIKVLLYNYYLKDYILREI